MKNKLKFFILFLVFAVMSAFFSVNTFAANLTGPEIKSQISSTYQKARASKGGSFSGYCGGYVGWQLYHLGINSSYISFDGNYTFDYYKNLSYSSGGYKISAYPSSGYTLKSALNQISQNGTKNVYNILIGLEKGNTSSAQIYGHTAFIHAIIDGMVYFSESKNLDLPRIGYFPEGTPICCSIDYFCDSIYMWNNGYAPVFDGVIHFQKDSEQPSVLTISGINYPVQKQNGSPFEVFGIISSPYLIEWGEAVVYNSDGTQVFGIGTYREHGRYTFNLNEFDYDMKFSALPAGQYKYVVRAHDSRGYTASVENSFAVGNFSTISATAATVIGTHDCDSMSGTSYTWDSGILEKSPTCTESGLMVYTCRECKKVKSVAVPASGHDFETEWTVDFEASECIPGQKSRHCKNCSEITDVTVIVFAYKGDVNGDGFTNAKDLVRLMSYLAEKPVEIFNPDINGDGNVNAIDLVLLMKYIAEYDIS